MSFTGRVRAYYAIEDTTINCVLVCESENRDHR